jgi:formylmethanofuran dehydrogenase subunit B
MREGAEGVKVRPDVGGQHTGKTGPYGLRNALAGSQTEYHSHVCAGCSCLCDDISLYLEGGRIVRSLNLCRIGVTRLLTITAEKRLPETPFPSLRESVRRALDIFTERGPVVCIGADSLDQAGIVASAELARSLRGVWVPWAFEGMSRFFEHAVRCGWATALLDEIRDRADIVVFWCVDPLVTHHRHLSRYSVFARGRFTERGAADRIVIGVGRDRTPIEPLCGYFFVVGPEKEADFIGAVAASTGARDTLGYKDLPMLLRALDRATYIAVFVDPERLTDAGLAALFEWSLSINRRGEKRMILFPLWTAGANAVGFAQASVDMFGTAWGRGFSEDLEAALRKRTWEALADQVGCVLMIESGPAGPTRRSLPDCLEDKPVVVLTPFKEPPVCRACVVIPTALPGVETEGMFFRADGLPLHAGRVECCTGKGYPRSEDVLDQMLLEVAL